MCAAQAAGGLPATVGAQELLQKGARASGADSPPMQGAETQREEGEVGLPLDLQVADP